MESKNILTALDNIAEAINNGGSGSSSGSGGGHLNVIITQDFNRQNGYSLNITKWSDLVNAIENNIGINFELHRTSRGRVCSPISWTYSAGDDNEGIPSSIAINFGNFMLNGGNFMIVQAMDFELQKFPNSDDINCINWNTEYTKKIQLIND